MEHGGRKNHGLLAILVTAIAVGCATAFTRPAIAADSYPSRPISMVLPFGAGTVTDITIRLIAEHLARAFGSPVVVENKVGAGGMIGSAFVARAQPNGYTLLLKDRST